jgi:hypothetical protein
MAGWEMKIITAEARRLLVLATEDADLRAELRTLAQEILAATEAPPLASEAEPESPSSGAEPAPPAGGGDPDGPTPHDVAEADRPRAAEPLRELTLGRSRPAPTEIREPTGAVPRPEPPDDLSLIEARCRAKAEAARWSAERQRRIHEGSASQIEDTPADREVAEWADRLTDCFYWLDSPDTSKPADLSLLDQVGGCFEGVAEALSVLTGMRARRGVIERSLPLLAEAQSALRRALQRLNAPDDPDQLAAYGWIKETAARHRIYLKRYMRADDLADPARWPDLLTRIEVIAAGSQPPRLLGPHVDRVRSHLKPIQEGQGTDQDWRAVIEAVEAMIGEGVPPSHREIRGLLVPLIDILPDRDDLPPGFRLVLREIDRFLATRTPSSEAGIAQAPTAEVREAARLLGGRSLVLIGGIRRRDAQESLRRVLGLRDLVWVETKEHQAIRAFEPTIAHPEVALVLLAIRWSSHAFGDVKQFCDWYSQPLVRVPGGYNPNQVAAQILSQCGERFGGE